MGPRDGAFGPSAIEVSVRVAGVTRTVPGLHAGAACPSWAPGVAAKNGACPELMHNSSRGASSFVETVKLHLLRAKARRPAQPSTACDFARRIGLFLHPLRASSTCKEWSANAFGCLSASTRKGRRMTRPPP